MTHLKRCYLSLLYQLIFQLLLLSPINSMTVPAGSINASGLQTAPLYQIAYSKQQPVLAPPKNFEHHNFMSIQEALIVTVKSTLINKPHVYRNEFPGPGANRTITFPNTVIMRWPWSDPEYQTAPTTKVLTSISVEANPTSIQHTADPAGAYMGIEHTGGYRVSVSAPPAIQFAQPPYPTRTRSRLTLVFDVSTNPTWNITVQWSPEQSTTSMRNLYVPSWTYRVPSLITGFTVVPTVIPDYLISTFFGSLGFARTKGYIIPIDENGTTGWHKRAMSIIGTKTNNEFIISTPVQRLLISKPEPIEEVGAPAALGDAFVRHSPTVSTISNKPTSIPNSTFNDAMRIAATQAFSQIGVICIAVLIIVGLAVVFFCCGSILRWPMKLLHAWGYGDIGKLNDATVPSKPRKLIRCDITRVEDHATLSPYARVRYLRGTAEAVSDCGFFDESYTSTGDPEQEPWQRAAPASLDGRGGSTADESMLTVTVLNSGSQSRSTGGRLRRTKSV